MKILTEDGTFIKAHTSVMAAQSPVISAILCDVDPPLTIALPTLCTYTWNLVLKFIYTSKVDVCELTVTPVYMQLLYNAAIWLNLTQLTSVLLSHLSVLPKFSPVVQYQQKVVVLPYDVQIPTSLDENKVPTTVSQIDNKTLEMSKKISTMKIVCRFCKDVFENRLELVNHIVDSCDTLHQNFSLSPTVEEASIQNNESIYYQPHSISARSKTLRSIKKSKDHNKELENYIGQFGLSFERNLRNTRNINVKNVENDFQYHQTDGNIVSIDNSEENISKTGYLSDRIHDQDSGTNYNNKHKSLNIIEEVQSKPTFTDLAENLNNSVQGLKRNASFPDAESPSINTVTVANNRKDDVILRKRRLKSSLYECINESCGSSFSKLYEFTSHLKLCLTGGTYRDPINSLQKDGIAFTLVDKSIGLSAVPSETSSSGRSPQYSKFSLVESPFKRGCKKYRRYYQCGECDNKDGGIRRMVDHVVNVHQKTKQFVCYKCQKGCYGLTELKDHYQSFHTKSATFECNICNKKFKCNKLLAVHRNNNHKLNNKGLQLRKYECQFCYKTFKMHHHKLNHEFSHLKNEDRPFQCHQCGKRFIRKQRLQEHIRMHTGEKPHHCSRCNFSCSKMYNLKLHERVHGVVNAKYKCITCNSLFMGNNNFQEHLRNKNHTGEQIITASADNMIDNPSTSTDTGFKDNLVISSLPLILTQISKITHNSVGNNATFSSACSVDNTTAKQQQKSHLYSLLQYPAVVDNTNTVSSVDTIVTPVPFNGTSQVDNSAAFRYIVPAAIYNATTKVEGTSDSLNNSYIHTLPLSSDLDVSYSNVSTTGGVKEMYNKSASLGRNDLIAVTPGNSNTAATEATFTTYSNRLDIDPSMTSTLLPTNEKDIHNLNTTSAIVNKSMYTQVFPIENLVSLPPQISQYRQDNLGMRTGNVTTSEESGSPRSMAFLHQLESIDHLDRIKPEIVPKVVLQYPSQEGLSNERLFHKVNSYIPHLHIQQPYTAGSNTKQENQPIQPTVSHNQFQSNSLQKTTDKPIVSNMYNISGFHGTSVGKPMESSIVNAFENLNRQKLTQVSMPSSTFTSSCENTSNKSYNIQPKFDSLEERTPIYILDKNASGNNKAQYLKEATTTFNKKELSSVNLEDSSNLNNIYTVSSTIKKESSGRIKSAMPSRNILLEYIRSLSAVSNPSAFTVLNTSTPQHHSQEISIPQPNLQQSSIAYESTYPESSQVFYPRESFTNLLFSSSVEGSEVVVGSDDMIQAPTQDTVSQGSYSVNASQINVNANNGCSDMNVIKCDGAIVDTVVTATQSESENYLLYSFKSDSSKEPAVGEQGKRTSKAKKRKRSK